MCTYYRENGKIPCCTHDCDWCMFHEEIEDGEDEEPEIEISPLTEEDVKEDSELENRLKKYGYLTDEWGR